MTDGRCGRGVTLVLGGTRSGKSAVAERIIADLAVDEGIPVTYVATATVADQDMERRVAAHRARRPPTWTTVEVRDGVELPALVSRLGGGVIIDSLGTWVASTPDLDVDEHALAHALRTRVGPTVVVSDEVGLAVHPPTSVGRVFVDTLGRLNQAVAAVADRVLLVVAGRTLELP